MNRYAAWLTITLLCGWTGVTAGPSDDPIEAAIDRMSVDERIGRLLFIAFTGTTSDVDLDRALDELHPGGVLFYSRNVGTLTEVQVLTRRVHRGALPPLTGIDEEGGFVVRLPEGIPHLPSAMAMGATRSEALTEETGLQLGHCLRASGFDLDFAPVLDVHSAISQSWIGTRAISDDEALVARIGGAFIHGASSAGLLTVAKHFPGIGATSDDPHQTTPRLRGPQLVPFRAAIAAGVPCVMTAHAVVSTNDAERPVSISPAWHEVLRRDLRFDGVIMSDALQMEGLPKTQGIGRAAVAAILAGSDMVVTSWTPRERTAVRDALRDAYTHGEISEARLRISLRRLIALQRRLASTPVLPCGTSDLDQRIARASVTLVRGKRPLLRGGKTLYVGVDGPLRRAFTNAVLLPHTIEHPRYFERQLAAAPQPRSIVAAAYNESQTAIVRTAHKQFPGSRLVFIDLGSPYLLAGLKADVEICTYGAGDAEQQAALDVLRGVRSAAGTMPIRGVAKP
ncbi:MAG: glycoside hydrolase family 3 protein [Thermoanaerobaculia bacterium]